MDTEPKKEAPKAAKKGINWLSIFGIVILVVLIAAIVWAMMIWNQGKDNRLIKAFMDIEPKLAEMDTLTQSQIENQGQPVTAADLAQDPTGYADVYVVVDGTVSAEESQVVDQNIARNVFTDTKFKAYILDDSVVMVDVTGTGPELPEGTVIRGYGVLLLVNIDDIWKLPVVGPNLKREFANVEGMSKQIVFFFSKGVKIMAPARPKDELPPPGAKPEGEKPAGEAAPPAEGEAATPPPASGETKPPAEGEGKGGETQPPAGGEGKGGEETPPPAPPGGK